MSLIAVMTTFTATIFVISALGKLSSWSVVGTYIASIGAVRRSSIGRATAAILIAAELAVGAMLLYSPTRQFVAVAAAVLGLLFVIVHGIAVRRGIRQPCRCFGSIDAHLNPTIALLRAIVLWGIATVIAYRAWAVDNGLMQPTAYSLASDAMAAGTYAIAFPLMSHALNALKRAQDLRVAQLTFSRRLAIHRD